MIAESGSITGGEHPLPARGDLRFKVTALRRRVGNRQVENRLVAPQVLAGRRPAATTRPPGYGSDPPTDPDGVANPGLRIGDVEVAPAPVLVETHLEALTGGVRVTATAEFSWSGRCRRCLGPAVGTGSAELRELFVDDPGAHPGPGAQGSGEIGGDDTDSAPRRLLAGWIDLTEPVRETVLLGLPLAPLCSPDCAGPSPEEFPVVLADDPPHPDGEPPDPDGGPGMTGDPRWAALDELHFDPEDT